MLELVLIPFLHYFLKNSIEIPSLDIWFRSTYTQKFNFVQIFCEIPKVLSNLNLTLKFGTYEISFKSSSPQGSSWNFKFQTLGPNNRNLLRYLPRINCQIWIQLPSSLPFLPTNNHISKLQNSNPIKNIKIPTPYSALQLLTIYQFQTSDLIQNSINTFK